MVDEAVGSRCSRVTWITGSRACRSTLDGSRDPRRRRRRCSSTSARRSRRRRCTCPGPTSSTASSRCPTARRACCAACSRSSTPAGSAGTGYVSILPVDQGIEHSAGASFAPEPDVLRPREHREARDRGRLQRGGLDARRARLGGAQVRAQDPVHREVQPQRVPHLPEQVRPDPRSRSVKQACDMGAVGGRRHDLLRLRGVDAADQSRSREAFQQAHELGMATVLWCYLRNPAFKTKDDGLPPVRRPHRPGQPPRRHDRGRHHQAEAAGEQRRLQRALELRQDAQDASTRSSRRDHPIDLTRYQVANCYMGRAGLINSGGASRARTTSPTP